MKLTSVEQCNYCLMFYKQLHNNNELSNYVVCMLTHYKFTDISLKLA